MVKRFHLSFQAFDLVLVMDEVCYPSYFVDASSLQIEDPCEQQQEREIASNLHHHGSRERRRPGWRRGARSHRRSSRQHLLLLPHAASSPCQPASTSHHKPEVELGLTRRC
uniref:Uncharacterized protein n=1 Tax=Arundo donax TaxID=35708 RepID=A0A0A9B9T9_ARUDO